MLSISTTGEARASPLLMSDQELADVFEAFRQEEVRGRATKAPPKPPKPPKGFPLPPHLRAFWLSEPKTQFLEQTCQSTNDCGKKQGRVDHTTLRTFFCYHPIESLMTLSELNPACLRPAAICRHLNRVIRHFLTLIGAP
jgi:hypothetical protein